MINEINEPDDPILEGEEEQMDENYLTEQAPMVPWNETKLAGSSRYFTYREKINAQIKELEGRVEELKKIRQMLDENKTIEDILDSLRKLGI